MAAGFADDSQSLVNQPVKDDPASRSSAHQHTQRRAKSQQLGASELSGVTDSVDDLMGPDKVTNPKVGNAFAKQVVRVTMQAHTRLPAAKAHAALIGHPPSAAAAALPPPLPLPLLLTPPRAAKLLPRPGPPLGLLPPAPPLVLAPAPEDPAPPVAFPPRPAAVPRPAAIPPRLALSMHAAGAGARRPKLAQGVLY